MITCPTNAINTAQINSANAERYTASKATARLRNMVFMPPMLKPLLENCKFGVT